MLVASPRFEPALLALLVGTSSTERRGDGGEFFLRDAEAIRTCSRRGSVTDSVQESYEGSRSALGSNWGTIAPKHQGKLRITARAIGTREVWLAFPENEKLF
jgi:hypothetical protein